MKALHKTIGLAFMACVFGFSNFAFADNLLILKSSPSAKNGKITLGDIFENTGALENQVLAIAPSNGQNAIFSADVLKSRALSFGLVWPNSEKLSRVIVTTKAGQDNLNASNAYNAQIPVLLNDIKRDEIITEDMIGYVDSPNISKQGAISDIMSLLGQAAKRNLTANTPIFANDITAPKAVKRGMPVNLIYEVKGIRISLRARALTDGVVGATIKATNLSTNKVLSAIVESDGNARVISPLESASLQTPQDRSKP